MPSASWANLVKEADVSDDKVVDPGEYDLVLKGVKVKETKAHDPMYNCRYSIENGPHAGTTVWDNIIIFQAADKQQALRIHLRKLFTLGADSQFLASEPTDDDIIKKIVGARVIATLEIDEFGGSPRNNIKSMKANKDAAPAAPAPAPAAPKAEKATEAPAEDSTPAESDSEAQAEKPKTKARGSIPLPPPA